MPKIDLTDQEITFLIDGVPAIPLMGNFLELTPLLSIVASINEKLKESLEPPKQKKKSKKA